MIQNRALLTFNHRSCRLPQVLRKAETATSTITNTAPVPPTTQTPQRRAPEWSRSAGRPFLRNRTVIVLHHRGGPRRPGTPPLNPLVPHTDTGPADTDAAAAGAETAAQASTKAAGGGGPAREIRRRPALLVLQPELGHLLELLHGKPVAQ